MRFDGRLFDKAVGTCAIIVIAACTAYICAFIVRELYRMVA